MIAPKYVLILLILSSQSMLNRKRLPFVLVVFLIFTVSAFQPQSSLAFDLERSSKQDLSRELPLLFPIGTPRTGVEKVLVEQEGAEIEPVKDRPNIIEYRYRPALRGPVDNETKTIRVVYDSAWNVHQISGTGLSGGVLPKGPAKNRADRVVFAFEDYSSTDDLVLTLREMLPMETDRSEVEQVLVHWAQALPYLAQDNSQVVLYRHEKNFPQGGEQQTPFVWVIRADYTKDDRLLQLHVSTGPSSSVFEHDRAYWLKNKIKIK